MLTKLQRFMLNRYVLVAAFVASFGGAMQGLSGRAVATCTDPASCITDATASMSTQLLAVIAVVLGIAVTFLVIRIGWRWVRSFVK